MSEVWKEIAGSEGKYFVSNEGRVKSYKGRILQGTLSREGYLQVTLQWGGKTKGFLKHRLVAQAFHENPDDLYSVDHINRNRSDNRAVNLQWMSTRDNTDKAKFITLRETKTLIHEDGTEVEVDCVYSWAKDFGLDKSTAKRVFKGSTSRSRTGWRVKEEG